MSAPSALHEERVGLLEDLATLAGYTVDTPLHEVERPDLVRLHRQRPSLLIGDGKATEVPTDAATRTRLGTYAAAARAWMRGGVDVHVLLCHGPDPLHAWLSCLVCAARSAGLRTSSGHSEQIDELTFASGVQLRHDWKPSGAGLSLRAATNLYPFPS